MVDCVLYIILRVVIFFLKFLPLSVWLFLARGFGRIYYYFAWKENRKAYANLRLAFPQRPGRELKEIMRQMYQRFAQNLAEALYLPYMDESFIAKFVRIPDISVVGDALREKRGIIFLGSHAGSWELSNIACAGIFKNSRYAMLAQPQSRYKRMDAFLNGLRESKGCHVIRVDELKKMIEHLSQNNMLGTVVDHGGKDGIPIDFFGKLAMTPTGSVKLARKLGSKIILAFMRRVNGPFHEMLFKPYALVSTGNAPEDLKVNLTNINRIMESWIVRYPEEYLWFYKRWKHSPQRNILVLSDGKAGHVKQSLALVEMIKSVIPEVKNQIIEVKYKSGRLSAPLAFVGFFFGGKAVRLFLPLCLTKETVHRVLAGSYDIVISAGASLAAVNQAVALQNNAKSIAIMRPGIMPMNRFHLVIMPAHDRPSRQKNVLVTVGSLNTVSPESMKNDFEDLSSELTALKGLEASDKLKIGLLIGGDSKNYRLTAESVAFLCDQLKKVLEERDGFLFLTTSRRTSGKIVDTLKSAFKDDPRCKLSVFAAEHNPTGTVGGIFYLSDIVVVSGESISMVSEAAASGKYVVVFEPQRKAEDNKVRRFLDLLAQKEYIYLLKLSELYDGLSRLATTRPDRAVFDTKSAILEELKKII